MAQGIGAGGILGIALETTSGTYTAPTKFVPFDSESLGYQQDTQWQRPIRNTPGLVAAVHGNVHAEGELAMEALTEVIVYFLIASRHTMVKTGAAAPYTYVFTPSAVAVPTKTLSVTIKRGDEIFGYTGCIVGSFTFSIDSGSLKFSVNLVGSDEQEVTAALTPVWPTAEPFGAGMYTIQIPTATTVYDTDSFEFSVEHNAEPQFRLRGDGERGAMFASFGETDVTLSVERDFDTRADYDGYKELTKQAITLIASRDANNEITLSMPAAVKDTYEVNIGGQGDLVRASISYNGVIDATGKAYEIEVVSQENVTVTP